MYMSRDIMHCKPGRVKDMVEIFRKMASYMKSNGYPVPRVYTDVSGERYWTVVMETEVEDLEKFAEMAQAPMSDPAVAEAMRNYHDLVDEGKREIYRLEKL